VINLSNFIIIAGALSLGNGILHDVFVLLQRKPFDKELIRLLIDGHILIFSGLIYIASVHGLKTQQPLAYSVCLITALFLLGYCGLIFRILPSIVTILINVVALFWIILDLLETT
jgi:hypothetical protein